MLFPGHSVHRPCATTSGRLEWCDRIAQFAERYGSRYMLAFCRAEYGAVHLWLGSLDAGGSDA